MRTALSAVTMMIALTMPATVRGQAITTDSLVGHWVTAGQQPMSLILDAKGTYTAKMPPTSGAEWDPGWGPATVVLPHKWALRGDSIGFGFGGTGAAAYVPQLIPYKVELKGRQMILWPSPWSDHLETKEVPGPGNTKRFEFVRRPPQGNEKECGMVFTRLDPANPPPATDSVEVCR